jgi:hypothetical protein
VRLQGERENASESDAYHYAGLLFSKKQYVPANITITHTSLQRKRRADGKKLQTQKRREETAGVCFSSSPSARSRRHFAQIAPLAQK